MKGLLSLLLIFCLSTSFEKREITCVAIGDSITYLSDHVNETGNRITDTHFLIKRIFRNTVHHLMVAGGVVTGRVATFVKNI